MSKYICIREAYDWISVGNNENELLESEFSELIKYLENKKDNFDSGIIEVKYKRLRVINYVGVISLSSVTLEILPKISLSGNMEKDREVLLQMLSKCNKLPFSINESMSLNLKNYDLIDLLAKFFLKHLQNQVNKGIYFEYINKEENLNLIKGKLLLNDHIRINYADKVKAYCRFDEYSENNFLNNVFKQVCMLILCKVNNDEVKNDTKRLISIFCDVNLEYIDKNKLINYKFHRQNNRFKEAYEFAKLILLNMTMENSVGNDNAFSMLFEINTLYEEYIGNIVSQIWNSQDRYTLLQDKSKYLLNNINTNRGNFNIKPDIVLSDKHEKFDIIIDTKWKSAGSKIGSSDIYQMYAYITRYVKAKKCILLYPFNNDMKKREYIKWQLFKPFEDRYIEVKTVRLDNLNSTIEDLNKILEIQGLSK